MEGTFVEYGVHGIQAETVDVVVRKPHEGIGHDEIAGPVTAFAVEVHGRAPGRPVPVCEVRPELVQIISRRAQVVVDDVQDDPQVPAMAGVDEPLETVGPAIGTVGGPEVGTVITPSPSPAAFGHGHDLDHVYAQVDQVAQMVNGPVESALLAEGADVHLVDNRR